MNDKTVTIKPEVTKRFSELTPEEKCIYNSGYDNGWKAGVAWGFVIMVIITIACYFVSK